MAKPVHHIIPVKSSIDIELGRRYDDYFARARALGVTEERAHIILQEWTLVSRQSPHTDALWAIEKASRALVEENS